MAASSSQATSPPNLQDVEPLKVALKKTKDDMNRISRELKFLPRLQDALTKMLQLVKLCKTGIGKDESKREFLASWRNLQNIVFDPILREMRDKEVSISDSLTNELRIVFTDIINVIPNKDQLAASSKLERLRGHVEIEEPLKNTKSTIDRLLSTFQTKGRIKSEVRDIDGKQIISITQANPVDSEVPSTDDPDMSDMPSHVKSVLEKCPRFRILLLGKSGVGKSSLINEMFKLPLAEVSEFKAGNADINDEFTSSSNPRFVLHDSCGFEAGSPEKFNIVEQFIRDRQNREPLSERLHAIWLCTAVPATGGRLFEGGSEKLLKTDLGSVPLIVVFTKYDDLVEKFDREADDDDDNIGDEVKAKASQEFQKVCIEPLRLVVGRLEREMPPFVKVSVKSTYEATLAELSQTTRECVAGESLWLIWAIAQRADVDSNVKASIEIGRRRYWKGLASSTSFREKPLIKCLAALHFDITAAWNFYDPHEFLNSDETKALMSLLVDDLADHDSDSANPTRALGNGLPGVAGVTRLIGAVDPGAAVIVAPVAVVILLAKWVYEVYRCTSGILRCLMGYIIDLTIVLRRVFWHMREKGGIQSVPRHLFQEVFQEFEDSGEKEQVHREIRTFVDNIRWQRFERDVVLEEVIRLIEEHYLDPRYRLEN